MAGRFPLYTDADIHGPVVEELARQDDPFRYPVVHIQTQALNGLLARCACADELVRSFLAYGVSGRPTFVLVDGEGVIRSYSVGYSPAKSLGIEGFASRSASCEHELEESVK